MNWFSASALLALSLAAAQDPLASLDELAKAHLAKHRIPGLVVAVVRGNQVAYAKGFGAASVETDEPVTPDHLFRAGSTTKMFVAVAMLRLAETGKLKLDVAAGDLIRDIDPALAKLTPHQLLSHTSGLVDLTLMYGAHDDGALAANVRQLRADSLFTTPGAIFSYSNLGYVVAGRIIENVTGRAFADAMKDLVFTPLAMTRTTFRPTVAMTYPLAQGHTPSGAGPAVARPAADHSGYWPAGSMFTSGREFARMALALLNEGRLDGRQALSSALVKEMLTPRVDAASVAGARYGYGLTFRDGGRIVEHGGSRLGYTSHLRLAPEEKTGVVVLGNLSGGNVEGLATAAFARITGRKTDDARPAPVNVAPQKLAGVYTHANRVVVVRADGEKLFAETEGRAFELTPAGGACYEVAGRGTGCFTLGDDGRARYFTLGSRSLARR